MSASYQLAQSKLEPIEGGYCIGWECGTAGSGETYRGIDRKQHPEWSGWKLVDQYKKQFGRPKKQGKFTGMLGDAINTEVIIFYVAFWNSMGLGNINNQTLANLIYTFIVQRQYAAVAVINSVAKLLGATTLSKYKITPQAAAAIELNVSNGYSLTRNAIIAHYNGLKNGATYIKNRVNIYPATLTGSAAQPAQNNAGWLAAFFAGLTMIK